MKKTATEIKKLAAKTLFNEGRTQAEIAEAVGTSQQNVSNWIGRLGWEGQRQDIYDIPGYVTAIRAGLLRRLHEYIGSGECNEDLLDRMIANLGRLDKAGPDSDYKVLVCAEIVAGLEKESEEVRQTVIAVTERYVDRLGKETVV